MVDESTAKLEALIKLARRYKLKSMTVDTISFEFEQKAPKTRIRQPKEVPILGDKMPADDDMLFYSSDSPIQVDKRDQ